MADAFPAVCDILAELQVQRRMDIRTINRLNNALLAYARRAMGWAADGDEKARTAINKRAERYVRSLMKDGTAPDDEPGELFDALAPRVEVFRQSLAPLIADRAMVEKEMRKLARGLDVWSGFGADVAGLGELGLAVIVGECGDLAKYTGPAKVWKRCGLAPHNGKAGSTWRMKGGLSADEWTALGYAPNRLAEIFSVVSDPLFRAQTVAMRRGGGQSVIDTQRRHAAPYRLVYDARRARTAETHPDWTKMHSHRDAVRVMTKALLRDLWCAWNGRAVKVPPVEAAA